VTARPGVLRETREQLRILTQHWLRRMRMRSDRIFRKDARAAITEQERQSLTVWGEMFSAQIRPGGIALYLRPEAPRSTEEGRPFLLGDVDMAKLRELLNEARLR
jgi:hypothetical protein